MINNSRIVPIEKCDYLSMIGTIMKLAGTSVTGVNATDPGEFAITSGSGNVLASEPIKTFDIGSSVSSITIYFVPAYDYAGFSIAGTAVETAGAEVDPDGRTLYSATLSSGTITIAKVGF